MHIRLAPLFALINNLIEIRLDAWKLLWKYKRPIPYKASNIGIWNDILSAVSYFAVLTNVKSSVLNKNYRNIYFLGNSHCLDIGIYSKNGLSFNRINRNKS